MTMSPSCGREAFTSPRLRQNSRFTSGPSAGEDLDSSWGLAMRGCRAMVEVATAVNQDGLGLVAKFHRKDMKNGLQCRSGGRPASHLVDGMQLIAMRGHDSPRSSCRIFHWLGDRGQCAARTTELPRRSIRSAVMAPWTPKMVTAAGNEVHDRVTTKIPDLEATVWVGF